MGFCFRFRNFGRGSVFVVCVLLGLVVVCFECFVGWFNCYYLWFFVECVIDECVIGVIYLFLIVGVVVDGFCGVVCVGSDVNFYCIGVVVINCCFWCWCWFWIGVGEVYGFGLVCED